MKILFCFLFSRRGVVLFLLSGLVTNPSSFSFGDISLLLFSFLELLFSSFSSNAILEGEYIVGNIGVMRSVPHSVQIKRLTVHFSVWSRC